MVAVLTRERLRAILHYDPETGVFTRVGSRGCSKDGRLLGSVHSKGYRTLHIDRRHYYLHRLAWLYMTGVWPHNQIDHIDGDKANNRFANLREASNRQNHGNRGLNRNNKSGRKGIWIDRNGRFRAMLGKKYLGTFDSMQAASIVRDHAAREHFGEFART